MKLVIFDLDQTIVNLFRVNDKAYHLTMADVFGIKACFKKIDYTGKRIEDLIKEYAVKEKIPNKKIDNHMRQAINKFENYFDQELHNVKRHLLPGIKKLIVSLNKKHKLAIVTGNLRHITLEVLKKAGLLKYFGVVVTSDDAPTRPAMVKLAIKKAGKASEVWVIGDSTRDISAGKANKTKTIGVMTGEHDRKTLMIAKPTHIFKDLSNTKKVLEVIG